MIWNIKNFQSSKLPGSHLLLLLTSILNTETLLKCYSLSISSREQNVFCQFFLSVSTVWMPRTNKNFIADAKVLNDSIQFNFYLNCFSFLFLWIRWRNQLLITVMSPIKMNVIWVLRKLLKWCGDSVYVIQIMEILM